MNKLKIAVIGTGLQGVCAAMALSQKKHTEIFLLDKEDDILNRASGVGEGKLHLGLVYAKDLSLNTADKLLNDALLFGPLLESLVGTKINWHALKSYPFDYVIADDSMLSLQDHEAFYHSVNQKYKRLLKDKHLHYAGTRPIDIVDFEKKSLHCYTNIQKSIATQEIALQPMLLKKLLKNILEIRENIYLETNCNVQNISEISNGYKIEAIRNGELWHSKYDLIINCSWENLFSLDHQMGITPKYPFMYRLKYRLLLNGFIQKPSISATIVQGPYGDVVSYPHSSQIYMSWYPACLDGISTSRSIPETWEAKINGGNKNVELIAKESVKGIGHYIPGLEKYRVSDIRPGIILARGETDIDDPNSSLHERNDLPIQQKDGYFSINTGKFTSAPHNAYLLSKII